MNYFSTILEYILRKFGYEKTKATKPDIMKNSDYTLKYKNIEKINFTAIFSKRLSKYAVNESEFNIPEENKRADLLREAGMSVWNKMDKIVSSALGTGGAVIVPYVKDRKIYFDFATQERLFIHRKNGETITQASVIADSVVYNNRQYLRIADYKIENNTLYIQNKTVEASSGKETVIDSWKGIEDVIIQNVSRVPFGFIKSPVDNRQCSDDYGVPITFGCEETLKDIHNCIEQIRREFKLKRTRLLIDSRSRIFKKDKDGNAVIDDNDVYVPGYNPENKPMFDIFDPLLRDSSYYNRLQNLFAQLEKEIGVSRGILTEPLSTYENSDKVREAVGATFAIVTDIRKSIETAMNDFLYTCDVLANFYNLSPQGAYTLDFDWDYSMIESSTQTWQQLKDAQSIGIKSKAELRMWLTGESQENAQKAIDEIKKTEPTITDLIG